MSAHPSNHEILDGYRLIRFLGRGGFGEVWLCRSEAMGDYRALKWIPTSNPESLEKEYESLLHYRKAAARLRSPHLVPIEHINRDDAGLYYVMPLADGLTPHDPSDPAWQPLSLTAMIHAQAAKQAWFTSREVAALLLPILEGLQILSDAGLVHRDVKPDNILFFNGLPCLGDISLLGADASVITRRGTPGYATPSWYVGGHPDMYGAAATLYTLLTGNPPDKLGRAAFLWPPQGESSLTETERAEWKRLHGIIRRAADEKISERFVDFMAMARHSAPEKGLWSRRCKRHRANRTAMHDG
jgi:serine/threonine-protein kinase